ncbi:TPA: peptide deformylase [Candidatus Collierbacteria bacterium]|uniref:Peptide deformylase n=1 Tax=Candidatus Collierbacteria bacterium GW2011_GWB2_44_22 TaxID=1618387 RepID=A0A0G1HX66_9BACT|nr:MAG: Peptide deformylase [Candidatus Collierbacteria bacterium GW2011_GWA2_44_13]KKT49118.1 MAG: Peptide deformylase [Candidatus Collierbacteria bacterium GW2011_GWB1_44_197]KKT51701.1 MAG: Peptide deformylase [Candidatus Collierbacteria bacterium GW2011_GWB2_44_22]KKT62498.1 MAG: Peptide deformylase [Candidatus Collierbacteria bacterium GW2011_GWD1_44_27]KKT66920.1 MAG: Peptide deformylase [Candidatus Collierbacteria bacterium GW2011_GWC2_44_30]KKT88747.1 MAG: Peptide deformylase [Candidat
MKILVTPDKFLRVKAKPVLNYDKKLEKQISEMIKILKSSRDPEGVGLAATQVGLDRRLFIVSLNGKPEIFINPIISWSSEALLSDIHSKKKDRWLEGCLSLPKIWGFVDRPYSIEMDYVTPEDGILVPRHRKFEDVESAYVQHENDHLDGILFTDHILKQGGQIFKETPDGLTPIDKI